MPEDRYSPRTRRFEPHEVMTDTDFNKILDFIDATGYSGLLNAHCWVEHYKGLHENCGNKLLEVRLENIKLLDEKKLSAKVNATVITLLSLFGIAGWLTVIFG